MRVTNLSGDLLDYWVARAERIEHGPDLRPMKPGNVLVKVWAKDQGFTFYTPYTPSTVIEQAWPIIERDHISLQYVDWISVPQWGASPDRFAHTELRGDTALIAAMRARVFARYGATLPEEIPA
jgi:hypothetical protein